MFDPILDEKEKAAAQRLEELMQRVMFLDPSHPDFPEKLREIGRGFLEAADVVESVQAKRKPS